ncbi:MAG: tetratricopeptide repeat protein [Chloroflexi bacterium]|nr:tetratricopeptide repeat protein [Chloroflexota bacterium]
MRELALCFLGPWQATFAAESPPDFKYDKVRALLAYLAVQQLETSLELRRQLGDRRGLVICLNNLGAAAGRHGDYERSRIYYEEALVLSRELGNPSYIATLLANLGDVAEVQGEHRRAHELFAESLALRR